jgi:hypothetical protein
VPFAKRMNVHKETKEMETIVSKIEICLYVVILFIMAIVLAAATLEPGDEKTVVLVVLSTMLLLLLLFLTNLLTKSASEISWLGLFFGLDHHHNYTNTTINNGGITMNEKHKFQLLHKAHVGFHVNASLKAKSESDENVDR